MNAFENTALIITSISGPNAVMNSYAKKCKELNVSFIVIGDKASPSDFQLEGCDFFSLERQKTLPFKLTSLLPEKHYSRKNIGYLLAKDKDFIIETDDDNLPTDIFWNKSFDFNEARVVTHAGWVNVYNFFSKKKIWPRGFPLEEINKTNHLFQNKINHSAFIMQGLADGDADIDAIYRMTNDVSIMFQKDIPVVLSKGSWCPFNSQNTAWKKEVFPLLYLPSYCSFRMTDIWRSFIAQRIAWNCGWNIVFHNADVIQERNEHNLLKDFSDEIPGYLNNEKIRVVLEALDLKEGVEHITKNLMICYQAMIDNEWIGEAELPLVEAWCKEFITNK